MIRTGRWRIRRLSSRRWIAFRLKPEATQIGASNRGPGDPRSIIERYMTSERGVPGIGTIPLLSGLVFLSGASALIYQLLWLRLLGLVFGVTVHAASTVLASFMAGLAIGSYTTGRIAPRIRRPLLWFAAAEALIAHDRAAHALGARRAAGGLSRAAPHAAAVDGGADRDTLRDLVPRAPAANLADGGHAAHRHEVGADEDVGVGESLRPALRGEHGRRDLRRALRRPLVDPRGGHPPHVHRGGGVEPHGRRRRRARRPHHPSGHGRRPSRSSRQRTRTSSTGARGRSFLASSRSRASLRWRSKSSGSGSTCWCCGRRSTPSR